MANLLAPSIYHTLTDQIQKSSTFSPLYKNPLQSSTKPRMQNMENNKEVKKLNKHNAETIKYIEKKLIDKGVQRLERHPSDGLSLTHLPKSGHGGKFTWEGPDDLAENELEAAPPAIDEKDPNYVDEEKEEKVVKEEGDGLVVGEVEVAKAVEEKAGIARVEVHPPQIV